MSMPSTVVELGCSRDKLYNKYHVSVMTALETLQNLSELSGHLSQTTFNDCILSQSTAHNLIYKKTLH